MTRLERIQNMSAEEMADFLTTICFRCNALILTTGIVKECREKLCKNCEIRNISRFCCDEEEMAKALMEDDGTWICPKKKQKQ